MKNFLENMLYERNHEKYIKYIIVKSLLLLLSKYYSINIDDARLISIINYYFEDNFKIFKINDFVDEIIVFFIKIIKDYDKQKLRNFNFLLEEIAIPSDLKTWFRENKNRLKEIIQYYLLDSSFEKKEIIASNDYFSIIKVTKTKGSNFFIPSINIDTLSIRIVSKGRVFYSNGFLLSENEYIITDSNCELGKYKLLSDELTLIIIILKNQFLKEFNIKQLQKTIQIPATFTLDKQKKLLNKKILRENFLFFLEILILILKNGNLISDDIVSISQIFSKDDLKINAIIKIIHKNIKLPEDEIKVKLEKQLKLTEKKLEEIFYSHYKLTLRKYIFKQKIKNILNEYINFGSGVKLENILIEYNFSNAKNFRYALKQIYNLSIKDIKGQYV